MKKNHSFSVTKSKEEGISADLISQAIKIEEETQGVDVSINVTVPESLFKSNNFPNLMALIKLAAQTQIKNVNTATNTLYDIKSTDQTLHLEALKTKQSTTIKSHVGKQNYSWNIIIKKDDFELKEVIQTINQLIRGYGDNQSETSQKILLKLDENSQLLEEIACSKSDKIKVEEKSSSISDSDQSKLKEKMRQCLNKFYEDHTKINRFNDEKIDAKEAYINLTIVEKARSKDVKKRTTTYEQMYRHRKVVNIDTLFAKEVSVDKPHRVLIKGAAGIGKTTLCKHFCRIYSLSFSTLPIIHIPWVFWLPFREIKACERKQESLIAEVIYHRYFAETSLPKEETLDVLITLLQAPEQVLLILDGFDEIAADFSATYSNQESKATPTYRALLNYAHCLVVSRPNYLERLPQKNRQFEFENIGFTRNDIFQYIDTYYNQAKTALKQFMVDNSKAMAMAHIPINVDLLCNAYLNHQKQEKLSFASSMGRLYSTVVEDILETWCKKIKVDDEQMKSNFIHYARAFLSLLSYHKMKEESDDKAYCITNTDITNVVNELQVEYKDIAKPQIKSIGFFVKEQLATQASIYQFIHLTFQEFFTANYLATSFKVGKGKRYQEARTLISEKQHEDRYQLVWWFMSSLLSQHVKANVQPLYEFLTLFLSVKTTNISNIDKLALYIRVLNEGPITENVCQHKAIQPIVKKAIQSIKKNVFNCIKAHQPKMLNKLYAAISSSQTLFYHHGLMVKILTRVGDSVSKFKYRLTEQSKFTTYQKKFILSLGLIGLHDKKNIKQLNTYIGNQKLQTVAAQSLMLLGESNKGIVNILIKTVHDDNFLVDYLGKNTWSSNESKAHIRFCQTLEQLLRENDAETRGTTPEFIDNFFKLLNLMFDDKLAQMLGAIKPKNDLIAFQIQYLLIQKKVESSLYAIKQLLFTSIKLYEDKTLRSVIFKKIFSLLTTFENKHIWGQVLTDWYQQLTEDEKTVYLQKRTNIFVNVSLENRLVRALWDEDRHVRRASANSLGLLGQGNELVIKALVNALRDEDRAVRHASANSLSLLGQGNELVIKALVNALRDEDRAVRHASANSLGLLGQGNELVIKALVNALRDEDRAVRRASANSLGLLDQGNELVIKALVNALRDEDRAVRRASANSLGSLGQVNESVIKALVNALRDKDRYVRGESANALELLGQDNESVIKALVNALGDKDWHVRRESAKSLGLLGQGNEPVIKALVNALGDKDWYVCCESAKSLGLLGQGDESVLKALVNALRIKDWHFRSASANALGLLGQGNESVIKALVNVLADKEWHVRYESVKALGLLGQGNESVIKALVNVLADKERHVRYESAKSLGLLGQGDESVIKALVNALGDKDWYVCCESAKSLGLLGQGDESVLKALVNALRDGYGHVRRASAKSLGLLGQVNESVLKALVNALRDGYGHVRSESAKSLYSIQNPKNTIYITGLIIKSMYQTKDMLAVNQFLKALNANLDIFEYYLPWLLTPKYNPEANVKKILTLTKLISQKNKNKHDLIPIKDSVLSLNQEKDKPLKKIEGGKKAEQVLPKLSKLFNVKVSNEEERIESSNIKFSLN